MSFAPKFADVARWCQTYLELQYSTDVGREFGRLLEVLGEISASPRDGVDRFDWLKTKEEQVSRGLQALADSFVAFQHSQNQAQVMREGRLRSTGNTRLFVYGTLKRGYSRSGSLATQQFVGAARTLPMYRIYDCGGYPGLVEDSKGVAVEGELWEVNAECLALLDEIEGVDLKLYERKQIHLAEPYANDDIESYFYCRDVSGLKDCGTCWRERN